MRALALTLVFAALAIPALAQPATPKGTLADIGFLVGDWTSGTGKVADTGDTDRGGSKITVEADGAALLRQDYTEIFDAHGKATGAFHQIMLIYPEGGTLHADYSDGEGHVIHYVRAEVVAGRSVVFTAPAQAAAPGFRLTYTLIAKNQLGVLFGLLPPGGAPFHEIASGSLHKAN